MNVSTAITCFALAAATSLVAKDLSITEFDQKESQSFDWRVVDDGVMGGLSAFGFIGLFLGPIVLGLLVALFRFTSEELAPGSNGA